MNSKAPLMGRAIALTQPEVQPKKEKIPNENYGPARRGKRGYTMYLNTISHQDLKDIAKDEDVTLQKLHIEGLNYVLQKRGRSPIAG